jgi:signal transduction histidine kinase
MARRNSDATVEKEKKSFTIFQPAIALMNRLNYPTKFLLIGILLVVPGIILLFLLTSVRNEAIDFGAKERLGLEYSRPVKRLLYDIIQQRQAALMYFEGSEQNQAAAKDQLAAMEKQIEKHIAEIDEVESRLGTELTSTEKWNALKRNWKELKAGLWRMTSEKAYDAYTKLIDDTVVLLYHVGDTSNLVLDPDIDSYYVMDAVVFRLPLLAQKLSLSRDLAARVALKKELPPDKIAELIFVQPGVVESTFDGVKTGVAKASDYVNPNKEAPRVGESIAKEYNEALNSVSQFLSETKDIKKVDLDSSYNATRHAETATMALASLMKLYDAQATTLDKLIETRVSALTFQKRIMQISVPILWIVVTFLMIGFYRSVMRTVDNLESISKKLVSGDTTEKVELEAKDELATVGESFNVIGQALVERNKELEDNKKKLEESFSLLGESYGKLEESNKQIQEQQTQLVQSEKMASLGQMVAGIAHEVNTPLGFVRNNIEVLEKTQRKVIDVMAQYRDLRDALMNNDLDHLETKLLTVWETATKLKLDSGNFTDKVKALIDESINGIDRIQELVLDLKNFSRLDEASFKDTDINNGIDSTLKIAHNIVKYKADVVREFSEGLRVECFPARINQVFLNIITNAAQAIESNRGLITIKTYREGEMAVVKIKDNGKGIPQENLKKIFEPFFTTKDIGQGTGLGLSIVYKIIEQHKGSITVQSEMGVGTEFTIKLPVKQKSAASSNGVPKVAEMMS